MRPFKDRLLAYLDDAVAYHRTRSRVVSNTLSERAFALVAEEVLGRVRTWASIQPDDQQPTGTDAGDVIETLRAIADKLEAAT